MQKEKVIVEAHEAGVEVLFQTVGIAVTGLQLADQGVQRGTEENELAGLGAAG